MSFDGLLVHDVTVVHPGSVVDRYGNTVPSWTSGVVEDAVKGWVSQESRSEELDGRRAEVSDWVAYFTPDTSVSAADRVRWEGLLFDVDGPVLPAWTPEGLHHYEARLKAVVG